MSLRTRSPNSAPHAIGSFLSAFVGWTSLNLTWFIELLSKPLERSWLPIWAIVSAFVIFFVWLMALLPLYLYIPARSILWRWPVCTLCGTVAAACIAWAVYSFLDPRGLAVKFPGFVLTALYLGVVSGGVTCLFGSLTAPLFRGQHSLDPVLHQMICRLEKMIRWLKEKFFELSGQ